MFKRHLRFIYLSILAILLNGCIISGFVGVPGVSVGGFGFGLDGVCISFIDDQGSVTSTITVDGYYSFENVNTGTWKMVPQKEGYYFYPGSIEKTGNNSSINLSEVNFLAIPVGPKTEWEGEFILRTYEDLQTLSGYHSVKGELIIETTSLTDLAGLESLTYVEGLRIQNNVALENLNGLNNLTIVGEMGFHITNNQALTTLNALSYLTNSYSDYIRISRNPNLTSIEGLAGSAEEGYYLLVLHNNTSLTSISDTFDGVRSEVYEGHYLISNQADIDALSGYRAVSGELKVADSTLTSLTGLESLIYAGGLVITNNSSLTSLEGLSSLTTVGDTNSYCYGPSLIINSNSSLASLHGLESLTTFLGSSANFWDNDSLLNFEGLNNLSKGSLSITVSQNMSLNSFGGLENIAPKTYFVIQGPNGITNFQGLEEVTTIRGMYLDGSSVVNFEGLNNLREITGPFHVMHSSIQGFDGLENLSIIDGDFRTQGNQSLVSMDALSNLESVSDFNITYNSNLTSVRLDSLYTVEGSFYVAQNDNLCNCVVSYLYSQVIGAEMRSYLNKDCTMDFYPPDPSVPEGMVRVPDLTRIMRYEAEDILEAGGLVRGFGAQYDDTIIMNAVISQVPAPGTIVDENSAVALIISKGPAPDTVYVPNVTGYYQVLAESTINSYNLTVGTITKVHDETIPENKVISQSPDKGTYVPFMSAVDIVVSLGPVKYPVPDLFGMTQISAQAAITDAGFNDCTIFGEYHPTVPAGIVIGQSPAADAQALPGACIYLTISRGPEPTTTKVPGLFNIPLSQAQSILEQENLTIGEISYGYYYYYQVGSVAFTDPPCGTTVPYGTPINVWVCLGPPE